MDHLSSSNLLIPKTFHQIWLGGKERPHRFLRYAESWVRHHPNWEYKLWTEDDLFPLINQTQFEAARTMAQKSDILRYEILLKYGGVYLDTDFECLKNIEVLLFELTAFSSFEDNQGTISNALMGSTSGHRAIAEIIKRLPHNFDPDRPPCDITGPQLLTHCVRDRSDITIFHQQVFYPVHYSGRVWGPLSEAFATHHWAHSWAPK